MGILEDNALVTYLPYFKIITQQIMEENRRVNRTQKNKKTQEKAKISMMKKRKANRTNNPFSGMHVEDTKPDPSALMKQHLKDEEEDQCYEDKFRDDDSVDF